MHSFDLKPETSWSSYPFWPMVIQFEKYFVILMFNNANYCWQILLSVVAFISDDAKASLPISHQNAKTKNQKLLPTMNQIIRAELQTSRKTKRVQLAFSTQLSNQVSSPVFAVRSIKVTQILLIKLKTWIVWLKKKNTKSILKNF